MAMLTSGYGESLSRQGSTSILRSIVVGALLLALSCTGSEFADQPQGFDAPEDQTSLASHGPGASDSTKNLFDSIFAESMEVYYSGSYDSARVLLEGMRSKALDQSSVPAQARATTWLGLVAWRLGDYQEARTLGTRALDLKMEHGLEDQLFRSLNALGLLAWNENRLSEAADLFDRALAVSQNTNILRDAAAASGNLALVNTELGRFDEALDGFTTMRDLASEVGETRTVGNAFTNLAMLEIRRGNPAAAIPYIQEARVRYDSVDYPTGVLSALGQLGTAYTGLGEPQAAFAVLDSALVMAREQGLRQEEASNLEALAELYREAGDFRRALGLYEQAKAINRDLGLDVETGADLRGEADIQARLGDLFEAHQLAEEALGIHRLAGAQLDELFDLLLLAEIQDGMQAVQAVKSTLYQANQLVEGLDARIARTQLALTEARIADRKGDSGRVLEITGAAREDLTRGRFAGEWEAHFLRSRAFLNLGEADSSLVAGRDAQKAVERVRKGFGSPVLSTTYASERQEVFAHLVSLLLDEGQVSEAFRISDASRGQALAHGIAAARGARSEPSDASMDRPEVSENRFGASSSTTAGLLEGESALWGIDQLLESIDYLEGFPPEERNTDQDLELGRLYSAVDSLRLYHEELIVRIAEADAAGAYLAGTAHPDAGEVQNALSADQVLIEYMVNPTGHLVIFALTPNELHHFESQVSSQSLANRVRLSRELIKRGPGHGSPSIPVLSRLHEFLLGPVREAGLLQHASEILIVPHGFLSYLPFSALYDETGGRYLAQDFQLRILPSAGALPALMANAPQGPGPRERASVLVPFPEELPATRAEADAVSRALPETRRYEGDEATEKELREALVTPDVVHVATHGVLNARNPMFSRLELARGGGGAANDGRLEVHELMGLSIQAPVVFLSGCDTGVGFSGSTSFASGNDFATLAQAFLYAGARNVVATLWPVDDAGAAHFATAFYQGLETGSPSQALAMAQRALMEHKDFGAPFYWAAYALLGDNLEGAHTLSTESVQQR